MKTEFLKIVLIFAVLILLLPAVLATARFGDTAPIIITGYDERKGTKQSTVTLDVEVPYFINPTDYKICYAVAPAGYYEGKWFSGEKAQVTADTTNSFSSQYTHYLKVKVEATGKDFFVNGFNYLIIAIPQGYDGMDCDFGMAAGSFQGNGSGSVNTSINAANYDIYWFAAPSGYGESTYTSGEQNELKHKFTFSKSESTLNYSYDIPDDEGYVPNLNWLAVGIKKGITPPIEIDDDQIQSGTGWGIISRPVFWGSDEFLDLMLGVEGFDSTDEIFYGEEIKKTVNYCTKNTCVFDQKLDNGTLQAYDKMLFGVGPEAVIDIKWAAGLSPCDFLFLHRKPNGENGKGVLECVIQNRTENVNVNKLLVDLVSIIEPDPEADLDWWDWDDDDDVKTVKFTIIKSNLGIDGDFNEEYLNQRIKENGSAQGLTVEFEISQSKINCISGACKFQSTGTLNLTNSELTNLNYDNSLANDYGIDVKNIKAENSFIHFRFPAGVYARDGDMTLNTTKIENAGHRVDAINISLNDSRLQFGTGGLLEPSKLTVTGLHSDSPYAIENAKITVTQDITLNNTRLVNVYDQVKSVNGSITMYYAQIWAQPSGAEIKAKKSIEIIGGQKAWGQEQKYPFDNISLKNSKRIKAEEGDIYFERTYAYDMLEDTISANGSITFNGATLWGEALKMSIQAQKVFIKNKAFLQFVHEIKADALEIIDSGMAFYSYGTTGEIYDLIELNDYLYIDSSEIKIASYPIGPAGIREIKVKKNASGKDPAVHLKNVDIHVDNWYVNELKIVNEDWDRKMKIENSRTSAAFNIGDKQGRHIYVESCEIIGSNNQTITKNDNWRVGGYFDLNTTDASENMFTLVNDVIREDPYPQMITHPCKIGYVICDHYDDTIDDGKTLECNITTERLGENRITDTLLNDFWAAVNANTSLTKVNVNIKTDVELERGNFKKPAGTTAEINLNLLGTAGKRVAVTKTQENTLNEIRVDNVSMSYADLTAGGRMEVTGKVSLDNSNMGSEKITDTIGGWTRLLVHEIKASILELDNFSHLNMGHAWTNFASTIQLTDHLFMRNSTISWHLPDPNFKYPAKIIITPPGTQISENKKAEKYAIYIEGSNKFVGEDSIRTVNNANENSLTITNNARYFPVKLVDGTLSPPIEISNYDTTANKSGDIELYTCRFEITPQEGRSWVNFNVDALHKVIITTGNEAHETFVRVQPRNEYALHTVDATCPPEDALPPTEYGVPVPTLVSISGFILDAATNRPVNGTFDAEIISAFDEGESCTKITGKPISNGLIDYVWGAEIGEECTLAAGKTHKVRITVHVGTESDTIEVDFTA